MKISPLKLELAMANAGYSFMVLAKKSSVSRTTLSYINNGKSCKPEVAGKIARALNITVNELIEQEV